MVIKIRIIAATNRDLEQMVKTGQFREDLWFRLNVFPIRVPPLRERSSDIPALVHHFLNLKSRDLKLPETPQLSPGAMKNLIHYNWPGNIRELQIIIERSLILNPKGPLHFDHFIQIENQNFIENKDSSNNSITLDEYTARYIRKILIKTNGKIYGEKGAAQILAINPSTLTWTSQNQKRITTKDTKSTKIV